VSEEQALQPTLEEPEEAGTDAAVEQMPVTEGAAEVEDLRQALEETKAKEAEYLDGWQRARAELANARKRFQREQEQSYASAQAELLARLLPIVDDLERAFATLPGNLSGLTWIEGVLLIYRKLQLLLEQAGVTPIDAVGQEFDPHTHQAVTHEPSDSVPAGSVIAELQRGFRIGDRVLRPTMVRVSSGPGPCAEAEGVVQPPVEEAASDERAQAQSDES
jgi:molecular chaperone GrpE